MDEIEALQAQLQKAQLQDVVRNISERNCIEIILKLIDTGRLKDIIFSQDGKEYITQKQLKEEIEDEILAHGGRISLVDIQPLLNVDMSHIQAIVTNIVNGRSVLMIGNEIVCDYYIDSIVEEINDIVDADGQVPVADMSQRFSIPFAIMLEAIQERIAGGSFRGTLNENVMYTETFVQRHHARLRGVLRGLLQPTTINTLIQKFDFIETITIQEIQRICADDEIPITCSGATARGTVTPTSYVRQQRQGIREFWLNNQYVSFSQLKNMNVVAPASFIKQNLGMFRNDGDDDEDPGILLSSCYIASSYPLRLTSMMESIRSEGEWLDASTILPTVCSEADVDRFVQESLERDNKAGAVEPPTQSDNSDIAAMSVIAERKSRQLAPSSPYVFSHGALVKCLEHIVPLVKDLALKAAQSKAALASSRHTLTTSAADEQSDDDGGRDVGERGADDAAADDGGGGQTLSNTQLKKLARKAKKDAKASGADDNGGVGKKGRKGKNKRGGGGDADADAHDDDDDDDGELGAASSRSRRGGNKNKGGGKKGGKKSRRRGDDSDDDIEDIEDNDETNGSRGRGGKKSGKKGGKKGGKPGGGPSSSFGLLQLQQMLSVGLRERKIVIHEASALADDDGGSSVTMLLARLLKADVMQYYESAIRQFSTGGGAAGSGDGGEGSGNATLHGAVNKPQQHKQCVDVLTTMYQHLHLFLSGVTSLTSSTSASPRQVPVDNLEGVEEAKSTDPVDNDAIASISSSYNVWQLAGQMSQYLFDTLCSQAIDLLLRNEAMHHDYAWSPGDVHDFTAPLTPGDRKSIVRFIGERKPLQTLYDKYLDLRSSLPGPAAADIAMPLNRCDRDKTLGLVQAMQEWIAAFEHSAFVCDIHLKKLDRKSDRNMVFQMRRALQGQLVEFLATSDVRDAMEKDDDQVLLAASVIPTTTSENEDGTVISTVASPSIAFQTIFYAIIVVFSQQYSVVPHVPSTPSAILAHLLFTLQPHLSDEAWQTLTSLMRRILGGKSETDGKSVAEMMKIVGEYGADPKSILQK